MARKSRKQDNQYTPVSAESYDVLAAGYVRLSVKDRDKRGNSIEVQQLIIRSYIDDHPEMKLVETYIDDGKSGTNFERMAFIKMMADIDRGKINCIIVKDISRFGRNLIETSYYVEKYLPSIGVRLVSINDGYDSTNDNTNNINFVLQSLFNEAYSLDIGRKIKSVVRIHMQSGKYVGGRPPFGYLKSPDDRYKLIIDEPAAVIVRQIFKWSSEGKRLPEMARLLNNAKVLTPSQYRLSQGMIRHESLVGKAWRPGTIAKILSDEVYIGNLVQGKINIKEHKKQPVPSAEWIRIDNTHQPIIPQELYKAAQMILHNEVVTGKKKHDTYTPNIFVGKIFCACCGSRMDRKRNHQKFVYRCRINYIAPGTCTGGNSIGEDVLINAVSDILVQYSDEMDENALDNLDATLIQSELARLRVDLFHCDKMLKGLYENLVSGIIDKQEYHELKAHYQQMRDESAQRQSELAAEHMELKIAQAEWKTLCDDLNSFLKSQLLTRGLVERLVRRIGISSDSRVYVEIDDIN